MVPLNDQRTGKSVPSGAIRREIVEEGAPNRDVPVKAQARERGDGLAADVQSWPRGP